MCYIELRTTQILEVQTSVVGTLGRWGCCIEFLKRVLVTFCLLLLLSLVQLGKVFEIRLCWHSKQLLLYNPTSTSIDFHPNFMANATFPFLIFSFNILRYCKVTYACIPPNNAHSWYIQSKMRIYILKFWIFVNIDVHNMWTLMFTIYGSMYTLGGVYIYTLWCATIFTHIVIT